jgi:hypothetical protein
MLLTVFCGRETWLLTVPAESIQIDDTGEENKDLMIGKLTGSWIKFHNEELHSFSSASNITVFSNGCTALSWALASYFSF